MHSLATTAKVWCVLIGMKHKPAVKVSQGYESSREYEPADVIRVCSDWECGCHLSTLCILTGVSHKLLPSRWMQLESSVCKVRASIIPRPERGRTKDLVSNVCTCA